MVKDHLNVTVEREVLGDIWGYKERNYPGLSNSAMIEILLRDAVSRKLKDEESRKLGLSVAK